MLHNLISQDPQISKSEIFENRQTQNSDVHRLIDSIPRPKLLEAGRPTRTSRNFFPYAQLFLKLEIQQIEVAVLFP